MPMGSAFIEQLSETTITTANNSSIPIATGAMSSNAPKTTDHEKNNDKITKTKLTKNPDSASPPPTSSSTRSPDHSPLTRPRVPPKRYAQLPSPINHRQKPSFLAGNLSSTSAWNENKPFVPLPLYLPIPDRPEPLSKFSASTGKSSKFISSPNRLSKKTLPARPDAGSTVEGGRGFKLKDLLLLNRTPFLRKKRQSKGNAGSSRKTGGLPVKGGGLGGGRKTSTPAATGSPSRDSITNSIASSKFFKSFGRVASIRKGKKEELVEHPMEEIVASKMSMEASSIKVAERRNVAVRSTNLQDFSKRPSRIPVSTLFPRPSLTRKPDAVIPATSRLSTVAASPAKRDWDSSQSNSAADVRPRSSTSKSRKPNRRDSNFLLPPDASYTSRSGSRRRSESPSSDQNISPLPPLPQQQPSPVKSLGRRRIALGPEENGIDAIRGGRRETLGATTDLANLIEFLHGGSSEKIGSSAHSDDGSYAFSESGFAMDFVNDREALSSSEHNPSSSSVGSRNYQVNTGNFSNASSHSIDSREDTADIPGDLLMLMRSVEEGIASSSKEEEYLVAPISASPTASSFEGRYSTAAMAIRSMLMAPSSFGRKVDSPASPPSPETGRGGGRGWLSDSPESSSGRDYGRRDNLEGDKMLASLAKDVVLSSIVGDSPSPTSTPQEVTLSSIGQLSSPEQPVVSPPSTDSSQLKSSSSSSMISSPCPTALFRPENIPRAGRRSLVRYSQDNNRLRIGNAKFPSGNYSDSMGSSCAIESTSESEDEMLPEPSGWKSKEDDHTSSTIFSLTSTNGSPCPLPVDRHVKMIGARSKDAGGGNGDPLGMQSSRSRKVARAGKSLFNLPNTSAVGAWTQSIILDSSTSETRPRSSYVAERNATGIIPPDTPPPSSPSTTSFSSSASNRSSAQTEPLHASSARFGRTLTHRLSFIGSDIAEDRRDEPTNLVDQVILEEQSFEEEAPDSFARDSLSIRSRWSGEIVEELATIRVVSKIGTEIDVESETQDRHFSFGEDLDFIFGSAGLKVPTDSPDRQARLDELGRFRHQVSQEIKSSQVDWPSTEFSRDFVAGFNPPRGTMAILDFIFDSQRRFRSRFATSPPQPTPVSRSSFLRPSPLPDVPVDVSPSPTPVAPFARPILGSKSNNVKHPVFAQLQAKPLEPSPFTALPPKLATRFKNLRAKPSNLKALIVESPSPKKKTVDVEFLGGKSGVSKRRMEQFDAARMKLEGNVTPIEQRQRSDEDEEESDLVGRGVGDSGSSFARTPKFSTKNRGQRRAGVSSLR